MNNSEQFGTSVNPSPETLRFVNPPAQPDALDRRDAWRAAWNVVTSDVVVLALAGLVVATLLAQATLPQTPAGGASDALAFSQWQAAARNAAGNLADLVEAMGLFDVANAAWARAVLCALLAVLCLRLLERIAHAVVSRRLRTSPVVLTESRLRVALDFGSLEGAARQLRQRRFHVSFPSQDWLVADRAPWAEAISIVAHVGALMATAGLLANALFGWTAPRVVASLSQPATLPNGARLRIVGVDEARQTARVQVGSLADVEVSYASLSGGANQPLRLSLAPLTLDIVGVDPEIHLSAVGASGQALTLTGSSYAVPAGEVVMALGAGEPQRLVGIEAARMAVQLAPEDGGRARVFEVPSGRVLADAPLAEALRVGGVTLNLKRVFGAAVHARYQPGQALVAVGAALALVGVLGGLAHPIGRIVVRRRDSWTEFYGAGRGAHDLVRSLKGE